MEGLIGLGVAAALMSALTQAVAHALLKSGNDKLIIRGAIGAVGALVMLPVCFFVPGVSPTLLPWLLVSNAAHAVYQLVLIRAYDQQDFSVAYPLARGIAPLATTALGVVILGDQLGPMGCVGVATVSIGLLSLALSRTPNSNGLQAAIVAGIFTTIYTVVDAKAVRLVADPWTFIAWFFVLDGLIMSTIAVVARGRRTLSLLRAEGARSIGAGMSSILTYASALIALRLLPTGGASALRETSVVFGALIAAMVLREPLTRQRVAGTLLVAIGGALVAVGLSKP